jgi:C-terminal processing protease CtpA/Prc
VLKLRRSSAAYANRLRPGDRILRLNGVTIETTAQLDEVLSASGREWALSIQRDDRVLNLVIRG